MMSGKANQRRGKQFELNVVKAINQLTPISGIKAEHLKRYDYGQSQADIKLHAEFELRTDLLDCKYTIGHFSCKDKFTLVKEAVKKYGLCDIVLGQRYGKQKLHMGNVSVLRGSYCPETDLPFYVELPLDYYLLTAKTLFNVCY